MYVYVQSVRSTLSQGFEEDNLVNSSGWLADTTATYCPGRLSQLEWKNITKHCDRVDLTLCTGMRQKTEEGWLRDPNSWLPPTDFTQPVPFVMVMPVCKQFEDWESEVCDYPTYVIGCTER